ncbi:MAG TPA: hypothetical protein VMS75_00890 [Terriglobales bacterium]|nr:hypothetical protein [Terriglobales bacterium]
MPHKRMTSPVVILLIAVAAVAIVFSLPRRAGGSRRERPLVGVKVYEHAGDLSALFSAWREAGINAAFVSPALLSNSEFRALAKKNGVATFVIFPVFFDAEALARRPDLYATTDKGGRAADDWVRFVCPTRADYRAEKAAALERIVREADPDGVSLDFIRFFVFWEMVYPDRRPESLPQTCFDASCLEDFSRKTGIAVPPALSGTPEVARWILDRHAREWADWKCGVIADTVRELAAAARRAKPGIKVNLHAVPWRAGDFGGAVRAVAGQDLARLAPLVDFISPMCYHHMVKRTPEWVHSVVVDAARVSGAAVLPSIQVKEAYIPGPETPAEFRAALLEALRPPSRGVVFWNWPALAESPEKLAAVREAVGPVR